MFTFFPLLINFILVFLVTCLLTFLVPRAVSALLLDSGLDRASCKFWETVLALLTFCVGIVLSFQSANINIVGIGVTFGAVSFIIGVSVKDIFPNVFASLIIQRMAHYTHGSYVSILTPNTELFGFIEDISTQQTCIRIYDTSLEKLTNRRVYVPNSDMLTTPIAVISDRIKMRYYEEELKKEQSLNAR